MFRSTSVWPLTASTIREFSSSSVVLGGSVLSVLTVSLQSVTVGHGGWFSVQTGTMVSKVPQGSVFGLQLYLLYTTVLFSILDNWLYSNAAGSTLIAVVSSPDERASGTESVNHDLNRVSKQCDLWRMKLNASKTKTMIISRSCTIHPQSTSLTGTVLKKSENLDILLGVIFF